MRGEQFGVRPDLDDAPAVQDDDPIGVWVRAFVAEHGERMSGLSRRGALKHL